ncbi:MAG: hypothetical protein ACXVHS_05620 [Methanobacterium sp.]
MRKEELINELANSDEYKAWQDSLLAIIEYSKDELNDNGLITDLIVKHINASLELGNALDRIKIEAHNREIEEFQEIDR